MTIDEAIKYYEVILAEPTTAAYPKPQEALRLGIEALKRAKACRPPFGRDDHSPLPGETEE